MSHTPECGCRIVSGYGQTGHLSGQQIAHCQLHAAAPELLAACKWYVAEEDRVCADVECSPINLKTFSDMARQAIANAEAP